MTTVALFLTVFLACAVEAVEATTIVLAAGTARDWPSALRGAGSGVVLLAVVIAALGPAVSALPLTALRLVVGGLLLVFGLQWLRKAILRAGGYRPEHRAGVGDWYAFTLAFKGVVLEGLEVAFIALTFGTNENDLPVAAVAALAAVGVVAAGGFAVRAPLARVPENAMKFAVGVMLTAFGTFWGAEGAGARWPGGESALGGVVVSVALLAVGLVAVLRRQLRRSGEIPAGVAG
jgi:uncharacterized membrane protein